MLIGEMAREANLPESTLRYYEKRGLLRVRRTSGGIRDYERSDVEWIKFIRRLKETGMHLDDIKHYAELRYMGESTMEERLGILEVHREYVLSEQQKWQEYMKNLDDKIAFYKESLKRDEG
ncbi:MerR family transcriptional regulator [Selenomonas sp. TAMA-11512]|uniref:MerR family transcriptional regulator n=1 Tax=Selenomonas sp. TAMA-11512 TaxID=3095337 RepID=UPI0030903072|nr:MerR family transcriptional regulator [Selenomonas sp. TAMA-11512]